MESKKCQLWAVHRLDEEVSGVLLFAKSAAAHRLANEWFEKRQVEKKYEAFSLPVSNPSTLSQKQVWKSKLLRGKKRAYERDFGKESVTEAQFEKNIELEDQKCAVWTLSPRTGRSHQLRYEMAKHGYPILGDSLYGSTAKWDHSGAIALRAVKLDFTRCKDRESLGLPVEIVVSDLESWLRGGKP